MMHGQQNVKKLKLLLVLWCPNRNSNQAHPELKYGV